jgi:hypothetical protein
MSQPRERDKAAEAELIPFPREDPSAPRQDDGLQHRAMEYGSDGADYFHVPDLLKPPESFQEFDLQNEFTDIQCNRKSADIRPSYYADSPLSRTRREAPLPLRKRPAVR